MRYSGYLIVSILWLSAMVVAGDKPANSTSYSDADKTFSIEASSHWKRQPDTEQSIPRCVLCISNMDATDANLNPTINVCELPHKNEKPPDLDAFADVLIQTARRDRPDQGRFGKIERIKLDGTDARSFVFLTQSASGVVDCTKTILAFRSGKVYMIQFLCAESEYKTKSESADKILATFHWK
ncbi:MAG TPA: hypothetical protein VFE47_20655 [Tepidisphaeraceae bacterium]|jgi:hypothetical protein|nr:hypothetical protein [Tepidisphaeraceae bacterium]